MQQQQVYIVAASQNSAETYSYPVHSQMHPHTNTRTHTAHKKTDSGTPPRLCDPWQRSREVAGYSSLTFRIVRVWVSVKPFNYRQSLHIHRWPDWLGIPHGSTPKPLTHISNANVGGEGRWIQHAHYQVQTNCRATPWQRHTTNILTAYLSVGGNYTKHLFSS